jgi:hypothetical protein
LSCILYPTAASGQKQWDGLRLWDTMKHVIDQPDVRTSFDARIRQSGAV